MMRAGVLALALCAGGAQAAELPIRIVAEGWTATAVLADTPSARDFAALLPLRLMLADYAATEKVANLPRKLTMEGAPAGHDPAVGDIGYYAPWGNLAIYYRDFGYSTGLVRLGGISGGLDMLRRPGNVAVTIERAGP